MYDQALHQHVCRLAHELHEGQALRLGCIDLLVADDGARPLGPTHAQVDAYDVKKFSRYKYPTLKKTQGNFTLEVGTGRGASPWPGGCRGG